VSNHRPCRLRLVKRALNIHYKKKQKFSSA
jgi:hypothetical protein